MVNSKKPTSIPPVLHRRNKLANKVWEQIQLAKAHKNGDTFTVKKFKTAFPLEMYLSGDVMDYQGQQEFFSKFGLEIKDVVTVSVSRRSFQQRVPQNTFTRPREGDLVYVPFLNGTGELYEITFTEQAKDFHMLGRKEPYFYELRLEKFKYAQEIIDTGVSDIDMIVNDSGYMIKLVTGAKTGNANNYIIN
jgi:hypothetical protein